MRPYHAAFPLFFILVLCLAGCSGLEIKPVVEWSEAEWHFEGDYDDDEIPDEFEFDGEIKGYWRRGIEVSGAVGKKDHKIRMYGSLSVATIDRVETDTWEIDGVNYAPETLSFTDGTDTLFEPDGAFAAFGVRSEIPEDGGFALDWKGQVGIHSLYDEHKTTMQKNEFRFIGTELDGRFGGLYAFPLGDRVLLSPRGGTQLKVVGGYMDWEVDNSATADYDRDAVYSMASIGLYLGVDLKFIAEYGTGLSLDYYIGTSDVQGILLSARFVF